MRQASREQVRRGEPDYFSPKNLPRSSETPKERNRFSAEWIDQQGMNGLCKQIGSLATHHFLRSCLSKAHSLSRSRNDLGGRDRSGPSSPSKSREVDEKL